MSGFISRDILSRKQMPLTFQAFARSGLWLLTSRAPRRPTIELPIYDTRLHKESHYFFSPFTAAHRTHIPPLLLNAAESAMPSMRTQLPTLRRSFRRHIVIIAADALAPPIKIHRPRAHRMPARQKADGHFGAFKDIIRPPAMMPHSSPPSLSLRRERSTRRAGSGATGAMRAE